MSEAFLEELNSILTEDKIRMAEPMSRHTSFRVGGPAKYYVTPDREEVSPVIKCCHNHQIPFFILGNGSNILVSDEGISGLVLDMPGKLDSIEKLSDTSFRAEAGVLLSRASSFALKESLTGMEPLAQIPGTVGGGLVMNAGAYGGEMKDVVLRAEILNPETGDVSERQVAELDLSYRHSRIMEEGGIVLSVTFGLRPGAAAEIQAAMQDFGARRREKQPLEYPSAGSTFKRPEGYFAGKLIQDAGLKGYTVGGACVSEKHSGFVINKDGATASDIFQLMKDVRAKVLDEFGVTLEPEVRLVGDWKETL